MPKPMIMHIEVEEVAFGRVFRLLDGTSGVIRINVNSEHAPPKKRGRPAASDGDLSAPQAGILRDRIVAAMLRTQDPLSRAELAEATQADAKGLSGPINQLIDEKIIRRTGRGVYQLTQRGRAYSPNMGA